MDVRIKLFIPSFDIHVHSLTHARTHMHWHTELTCVRFTHICATQAELVSETAFQLSVSGLMTNKTFRALTMRIQRELEEVITVFLHWEHDRNVVGQILFLYHRLHHFQPLPLISDTHLLLPVPISFLSKFSILNCTFASALASLSYMHNNSSQCPELFSPFLTW